MFFYLDPERMLKVTTSEPEVKLEAESRTIRSKPAKAPAWVEPTAFAWTKSSEEELAVPSRATLI